ncbi:MAG: isopentenyl phosphate kinase [Chloroflexota bacterium]|nr:isopentenyl phosphate kinase [Chloroflexota bacterium]
MKDSSSPSPRYKNPLLFLKLGGSLITDKTTPHTPRPTVIARLAQEIVAARKENPGLRLVLGHGSGSFGHVPAKKFNTRQGVDSPKDWRGFAQVWHEASSLNHIVMTALHAAGLPVISFPISGGVSVKNGRVATWNLIPLTAALKVGLLPVVFGDVAFDSIRGGTILSTEDIFAHLARQLHPQRILLAGIDAGVWADYPHCTELIPTITPESWKKAAPSLEGSAATDVTGGMASKVRAMLNLTVDVPGLDVLIFNGNQPGNVESAIRGKNIGTRLYNPKHHLIK